MTASGEPDGRVDVAAIAAREAATQVVDELLARLGTTTEGLSAYEAATRLARLGPNALRAHHARVLAVAGHQFHSPLLVLLVVTATVSFFLGQRADAVIIGVIVSLSVGLGFVNEYQAQRTSEALHSQLRHRTVARRDGQWTWCDITELVPGDVIRLELGAVVPADVRLLSCRWLGVQRGHPHRGVVAGGEASGAGGRGAVG